MDNLKDDSKLFLHVLKHLLKQQIKGSLSGLTQFLATENPLKMMKNDF